MIDGGNSIKGGASCSIREVKTEKANYIKSLKALMLKAADAYKATTGMSLPPITSTDPKDAAIYLQAISSVSDNEDVKAALENFKMINKAYESVSNCHLYGAEAADKMDKLKDEIEQKYNGLKTMMLAEYNKQYALNPITIKDLTDNVIGDLLKNSQIKEAYDNLQTETERISKEYEKAKLEGKYGSETYAKVTKAYEEMIEAENRLVKSGIDKYNKENTPITLEDIKTKKDMDAIINPVKGTKEYIEAGEKSLQYLSCVSIAEKEWPERIEYKENLELVGKDLADKINLAKKEWMTGSNDLIKILHAEHKIKVPDLVSVEELTLIKKAYLLSEYKKSQGVADKYILLKAQKDKYTNLLKEKVKATCIANGMSVIVSNSVVSNNKKVQETLSAFYVAVIDEYNKTTSMKIDPGFLDMFESEEGSIDKVMQVLLLSIKFDPDENPQRCPDILSKMEAAAAALKDLNSLLGDQGAGE